MDRLIDLTNRKFGRLTVVCRNAMNDKSGHPMWDCICECGNKTTVRGHALRSGNTKSCGCLSIETASNGNSKPSGVASENYLFANYKRSANSRGYSFHLTRDEFVSLLQQDCYYCGAKPGSTIKRYRKEYVYNGIDRKDNDEGYVLNNCVPCCKICNVAKHTLSYHEFRAWVRRVYLKIC